PSPLLLALGARPRPSPAPSPYTPLFRSPPARRASVPSAAWCSPPPDCTRAAPGWPVAVPPPPPCSARPTWSASASPTRWRRRSRSEEHTSELQSRFDLVCRLLLEKKKQG